MITVATPVSGRPYYLKQMLNSWAAVRGVEKLAFVFSLEPMNGVEQNMQYIYEFFYETHCKIEIKLNNEIQGPANNHYVALQAAYDMDWHSRYIIQAEEDLIVSEDIVEYLEWGLKISEASNNTPLVCAYSTKESGALEDVRLVDGFPNCWLWGTSKWWWKHYIGPNWDRYFTTGEGNEKGWDWALARYMKSQNWRSLQPDVSRAQNIGEIGWSTAPGSVVYVPTFDLKQPVSEFNLI